MTKLEQAARQIIVDWDSGIHLYEAITALREALGNSLKPKCFADYQPNHAIDRACASCPVAAECQTGEQAEQEPVCIDWDTKTDEPIMGYAAPVRTKDLTDDEIDTVEQRIYAKTIQKEKLQAVYLNEFARAVIAKFKEKNK